MPEGAAMTALTSPTPSVNTRRRLMNRRICYVCRTPIPARAGLIDFSLGIIVHVERCAALLASVRKDYRRSAKGRRFRPSKRSGAWRCRMWHRMSDQTMTRVTGDDALQEALRLIAKRMECWHAGV